MTACVSMCGHHNSFTDPSGKPLCSSVLAHEHSLPSTPMALCWTSLWTLQAVDSHQMTWIGSDIQMDDESLCAHVWASKQLQVCIRQALVSLSPGTRVFISVYTNGSVLDITIKSTTVDIYQITWIGSDIQMDHESLCVHVCASKNV
jgi:hypothetical protein